MTQILISVLILITSTFVKAELPTEAKAAIEAAEAYNKACEKHGFRPYRDKKLEEVSREDYFNLKDICASYSMASTLRSVQNVNKLEKENIEKLATLSTPEKIKNIEGRVMFLTNAFLHTPLTFAEGLIYLVVLGRYSDEVNQLKDKGLQKYFSKQVAKIKNNKSQIYEKIVKHDLTIMLAESRNANVGDPKDIEEFNKFISKLAPYSNKIKNNLSCLSKQKCQICEDRFEKKCVAKAKNTEHKVDDSLNMILERYAEGTEAFFRRVNKF